MDELTKVRIGTDITIRARLIDSGVAYDFSLTPPVAVRLLSLSQNSLVRDLEYAPDPDDGTVLVVTWRASGQCYTGDYRLIVSAELSGRTATFDAPAFTLVRLLEEAGTADQPDGGVSDIGVTLEVESIDTALITQILEECRAATEAAKEAAAAVTATDEAMKKSEAERVEAEAGRVSAEKARVSAEAARSDAESGRVSAEQTRQTAEKERAAAESLRASAEKERAIAEAQRQAAETKRQEDTAAAIAAAEAATGNAETATDEMQELYDTVLASESERVSAEQDREYAESERVAAEALRVQAEAKRQTDTAQAISDAEDATQAANDAAALANQNVLALQFDQDTGILSALVGQDGSAFESGEITDTGEVVLNFNYAEP